MNYEKIGEFIANKRKEKKLTQKELASIIGVTDKAVSKWERGLGCPDVSLLEVLANTLNVSILELLKGRIIENEVIPVTEANDYVLETVNFTRKKYDKIILNFISFIIIITCSILLFLNIIHIFYLNKEETYDFSNNELVENMKNIIDEIEENTKQIKNTNMIYKEKDKEEIIIFLEQFVNQYKNLSVLNYSGIHKFKMKDLYLLDNEDKQIIGSMSCYKILEKYNENIKEDSNMYMSSYLVKLYIGNNFYKEANQIYLYRIINYDSYFYNEQVMPRLFNIKWELEQILHLSKKVIEVGELNE